MLTIQITWWRCDCCWIDKQNSGLLDASLLQIVAAENKCEIIRVNMLTTFVCVCWAICQFALLKLLSAGCCLEEGCGGGYRIHLIWWMSVHQLCRLLSFSGWPGQSPPPQGCSLAQRERTGTGSAFRCHKRGRRSGVTERGRDSGKEGMGLRRRAS